MVEYRVLLRDDTSRWMLRNRHLPDLPVEVQSVEISVHKILPSAVVVAFDVNLTKVATNKLKDLHSHQYLSEVRFHNWMPWRKNSWGRSETNPEWAKQDAILAWEASLHSSVGRILTSYLSGFFCRSSHPQCSMPVIDVFSVKGVFGGQDDQVKLQANVASWMQSFILLPQVWSSNSYVSRELIFS
jgi:hypothetical protein